MKSDIAFICTRGKSYFAIPILIELQHNQQINICECNSKLSYLLSGYNKKIIWVEWAGSLAKFISKIKPSFQKLIIRLHRYEMYKKKCIDGIKWNSVDLVIFVNSQLERKFNMLHPEVSTATIPNALDISSFPFSNRTSQNTLLAYGIHFLPRKAYHKLIILFSKLLCIDSSFTLTIAGKNPDNEICKKYLDQCFTLVKKKNLEKNINLIIMGQNNKRLSKYNSINLLLQNQNAIISFSDNESFHYAFAEGLLSGLQGFCRGWGELDLKEFWSNWIYSNEEQMLRAILEWGKTTVEEREKIAKNNRKYVIDNFSAKIVAEKYIDIFNL